MAKVIEPPVLLSRALTFVLAASVVMLGVLVVTLVQMAPLTRPEVFFVRQQKRVVNYVLDQENPQNPQNYIDYIKGFIRTYVIARNTLEKPASVTQANWKKIVLPWSSSNTYSKFQATDTYQDVMHNRLYNVICWVDIKDVNPVTKNLDETTIPMEYVVSFTRYCKNSGGQQEQKSYTINIAIQSYLDKQSGNVLKNLNELQTDLRKNPLGIQVTKYSVMGKNNTKGIDPLSDLDFYKEGL